MTKKILIDTGQASDAIKWAVTHFGGGDNFTVQHDFPSSKYRFEFNNAAHATMFALRWA
jgi:hypothetical protein